MSVPFQDRKQNAVILPFTFHRKLGWAAVETLSGCKLMACYAASSISWFPGIALLQSAARTPLKLLRAKLRETAVGALPESACPRLNSTDQNET